MKSNLLAVLCLVFSTTAVSAEDKKVPAPADKKLPAPPVAATATAGAHIMIAPTDIKWGDAPPAIPKGAKFAVIEGDASVAGALVTFRLKLPNGWSIPPHFHPADEHITVIKGSFNMGMSGTFDKKAAKPFPAGSFMVMPKGSHHYGIAKGETIIQVHAIGPWGITYVNAADDPRTKPAEPAPPAKK